jgi:hypothetical protein
MMTNWLQSLLRKMGLARESGGVESPLPQTPAPGVPADMVDSQFLTGMVRAAMGTRDDEMDCDECYAQVDAFVEMHLNGVDAAAALPLVEDHLHRCPPCREEFEALLVALQGFDDPVESPNAP